MTCIPLVRNLLAYIAGPDLGRIPYPYLITQPLHQIEEPLAISCGLDPDQRRLAQLLVEPFCLAVGMAQLPLLELTCLRIAHRYLLKARVEITSYNLHKASPTPESLGPKPQDSLQDAEAFFLIQSGSPQRTWDEKEGRSPTSALVRIR